jgi:adenosylhomocysteine nucleosidase
VNERPAPNSADGPVAKESHCHIGFVFALGIEAGGLEDLLTDKKQTKGKSLVFKQGKLGKTPVAIVVGGPGRAAADRATEALIDGHSPDWIISAGFAGGLYPGLKAGDFLMADEVVNLQGKRYSIDIGLPEESRAANPRLHVGRLVTVDEIVGTVDGKDQLRREHDAVAVDMETSAVAEVCSQRIKRFLAVRIISDTADEELPPGLNRLMQERSTAGKIGATFANLIHKPSNLSKLWNLRERALAHSDRLAKFLASMTEQL